MLEHGWIGNQPDRIEPGRFLIGTGQAFSYRVVPEGDPVYMGIALDRPLNNGFMSNMNILKLTGFNDPLPVTIWEFASVDGRRTRIGVDRADRAFDMAELLERLLERFHSDPRHVLTGFLAESEGEMGIWWEHDASKPRQQGRLIRCIAPPMNSPTVKGASGAVYASHFRMHPPPAFDDPSFSPNGWPGRLTLVGQISCLWAVLKDRLAELAALPPSGARIDAIQILAGTSAHPLVWEKDRLQDLIRARGELQLWRGTDLISIACAADIPKVSTRTIERWIERGGLTAFGGGKLVSEAELRRKLPQLHQRKHR